MEQHTSLSIDIRNKEKFPLLKVTEERFYILIQF